MFDTQFFLNISRFNLTLRGHTECIAPQEQFSIWNVALLRLAKGNRKKIIEKIKKIIFPHNHGKSLVFNYKFYHIKIYISRKRLLDQDCISITNVQLSLKN